MLYEVITHWAIINEEKETGVTTMLMDEGLDTGDILLSSKLEIASDDTSDTLHDRLADLGADLLIQTLNAFQTGDINPISQDHSQATYAPILKKNDGRMNWERPAKARITSYNVCYTKLLRNHIYSLLK